MTLQGFKKFKFGGGGEGKQSKILYVRRMSPRGWVWEGDMCDPSCMCKAWEAKALVFPRKPLKQHFMNFN